MLNLLLKQFAQIVGIFYLENDDNIISNTNRHATEIHLKICGFIWLNA